MVLADAIGAVSRVGEVNGGPRARGLRVWVARGAPLLPVVAALGVYFSSERAPAWYVGTGGVTLCTEMCRMWNPRSLAAVCSLHLALFGLLLPGCTEKDPIPTFRHGDFFEQLDGDSEGWVFRDGDWLEDYAVPADDTERPPRDKGAGVIVAGAAAPADVAFPAGS